MDLERRGGIRIISLVRETHSVERGEWRYIVSGGLGKTREVKCDFGGRDGFAKTFR